MINSKLIHLLRSLSAWEWQRLRAFVASPYHACHPQAQVLAAYLHEQHPHYAEETISQKHLHQVLWGDKPFRSQSIRDIASYLTRTVEQFLALSHFQQQEFASAFSLLEALQARHLHKYYLQTRRKLRRSPDLPFSPEHHWQQYHLEAAQVQFRSRQQQRRRDGSFDQMLGHLDRWYLIMRLRYGCAALNRQQLLQAEADLELCDLLAGYVSQRRDPFEDSPLLMAYLHTYQLLRNPPSEADFAQLQANLQQQHDALSPDLLPELYGYLMNHCIRQINTGHAPYRSILLQLYQWQLEKKILLQEGWLSPWDYKNIVSLSLKMGHFDWAAEFMEHYRELINPAFRENAYRYNQATLAYARQDFPATLQLLQHVEFEDLFYQLGAKTLLLKVYYTTASYEALFSLLDAFEAFLRRPRQLATYQRDLYLKLVRLTRRLAQIRIKAELNPSLLKPKELSRLAQQIRTAPGLAQRDWLVEEVERLGG